MFYIFRVTIPILISLMIAGCIGKRPIAPSFSGIVLDAKTQQPISDVTLVLLSAKRDKIESVTTDNAGKFHFNGIYEYIFDYPMRGVPAPYGATVVIYPYQLFLLKHGYQQYLRYSNDLDRYEGKIYYFNPRSLNKEIVIYL